MLSLERLGKASLIDSYWEVFLLFGSAIQMFDDWQDLEGDLAAGHYSYVTLGYDGLEKMGDPRETARLLRGDPERVRQTYAASTEMINQSRAILDRLEDAYLVRFVDVTELRLENYFRKELKMG